MGTPRLAAIYESGVEVLAAMVERLWEYSEVDFQPIHAGRAAYGAAATVLRNLLPPLCPRAVATVDTH
jgi:hypothetical protein